MNKKNKIILMGGLLALLFITPISVFAIVYSGGRTNSFRPAQANVQVKEGSSRSDELKDMEYVLSKNTADDNYSVEKTVQIYDERSNSGEWLRVSLIPMWMDADGNVCGGIEGVTDISSIEQSGDKLIYYCGTGADKTAVITLSLADGWAGSWEYKDDGCFYYSGDVNADKTTPALIDRVEITKAVYDKTDGYELRLDVLADALQKSGNAYESRSW
ncbi:hypothetical protein SAMN02910317_03106 [Ruminococcaceae bacterium FB2012]|nr:hypothetical protein SAMN02910317_03106 [Ruminococcaceae bacterium FB2012]